MAINQCKLFMSQNKFYDGHKKQLNFLSKDKLNLSQNRQSTLSCQYAIFIIKIYSRKNLKLSYLSSKITYLRIITVLKI